jgi:glycosyltransferase involved in cell wall biosynthesis
MKVLAFASYPVEAAATRYRVHQFIGPLAERGIELTVSPFLDSKLFASFYQSSSAAKTAVKLFIASLRRLGHALDARDADVILIQREAMIFGPPVIEWLSMRLSGCPMMLDLDDPTYVPYTSPTYGNVGKVLKWFRKTDDLIRWASLVTCGNRAIAEYVKSKGTDAIVIPTVVDTEVFHPVARSENNRPVVLGWVGTHSTFPYLESIFPVLQDLAKNHDFRLKVIGAGKHEIAIPGVEIENLEWQLDREVADFQSFDIGLYPIDASLYADKWAAGKSGFKAIEYMSVGVPYVATPVGVLEEIGENGTTHFNATTPGEWRDALSKLIVDRDRRLRMGKAGRQYVLDHYTLGAQADKLAAALRQTVKGSLAG